MADSEPESRSVSPAGSGPLGSTSPQSVAKSESSPPPPDSTTDASSPTKKRASSTSEPGAAPKITKRRAARACVSCRARKVRCDVVEGAPCGNCRWDNVECIVQESRRRKKNIFTGSSASQFATAEAMRAKYQSPRPNPVAITTADDLRRPSSVSLVSGVEASVPGCVPAGVGAGDPLDGHMPHLIYQRMPGFRTDPAALLTKLPDTSGHTPFMYRPPLLGDTRTGSFLSSIDDLELVGLLPLFVKPLPGKLAPEDVKYLQAKGALTVPGLALQNAMLKAYVEYVHPYMPLLELHSFLRAINNRNGLEGQVSLFLYQAVMFVASAFVDFRFLKEEGFATRRAARKAFFTRTRLLYDFDYESDRLVLVQALLLMTYWYETPDDQKDTWHWMGVAISLAHTIGLHRNPSNTNMPPEKQKMWKRIWWSCFMRDRLIALGMRRPTRIKDEDFDVPMLEEADFEIEALPEENQVLSADCQLIRDVSMQQQLALMCIEKAKLCICVSHMLKVQYSVLTRDNFRPENTTNTSVMLFPNKTLDNVESVHLVDIELRTWHKNLPMCCQYRPLAHTEVNEQNATLAVQRNLLHMVYYTTLSALHRPQFLPASPCQAPAASRHIQEMSRFYVRDAAAKITDMATELHGLKLERLLPTTGVTVILPAMIIHLLDMKSPSFEACNRATRSFRACSRVMEKLRETYAAADFATAFLNAALRKAAADDAARPPQAFQPPGGKTLNGMIAPGLNFAGTPQPQTERMSTPPPDNIPYPNSTEVDIFHQNRTYPHRAANHGSGPIHGHTPPQSERETDSPNGRTPSGSVSSEDMAMDVDNHEPAESAEPADPIWGTVSNSNLDFDQWLQFPAEGVSNSDENFMGIFGVEQADKPVGSFDDIVGWPPNPPQHHLKHKFMT